MDMMGKNVVYLLMYHSKSIIYRNNINTEQMIFGTQKWFILTIKVIAPLSCIYEHDMPICKVSVEAALKFLTVCMDICT